MALQLATMAQWHFSSLAIFTALILINTEHISPIAAFAPSISTSPPKSLYVQSCSNGRRKLFMASSPREDNLGVIDLTDDDDDVPMTTESSYEEFNAMPNAPFLSQGELSDDPNLLSPDFSDGKQTRVIIYIILTLVPILFLVPLMIGSRDLIPLDALPPVEL